MSDLFHDSSFWVLIAFIVFILIVFLKASSAISKSLEQRGSYIQNKIGESEKTLLEAQNLLKESQNYSTVILLIFSQIYYFFFYLFLCLFLL